MTRKKFNVMNIYKFHDGLIAFTGLKPRSGNTRSWIL